MLQLESPILEGNISLERVDSVQIHHEFVSQSISCVEVVLKITAQGETPLHFDIVLHQFITSENLARKRLPIVPVLIANIHLGEAMHIGHQKLLLEGVVRKHGDEDILPVLHAFFHQFVVDEIV